MSASSSQSFTQQMVDWSKGDRAVLDEMLPFIYDELHRLAACYMRRERPDHTLQATALVHEAYLRLAAQHNIGRWTRNHFFAVAAQVMRHILVDHARGRHRAKRGDGALTVSLDEAAVLSDDRATDLIAIDDALISLAAIDPRKSQVFEMRYFGGMTLEETAEALKLSTATVTRDWRMAKAWLQREVSREDHCES